MHTTPIRRRDEHEPQPRGRPDSGGDDIAAAAGATRSEIAAAARATRSPAIAVAAPAAPSGIVVDAAARFVGRAGSGAPARAAAQPAPPPVADGPAWEREVAALRRDVEALHARLAAAEQRAGLTGPAADATAHDRARPSGPGAESTAHDPAGPTGPGAESTAHDEAGPTGPGAEATAHEPAGVAAPAREATAYGRAHGVGGHLRLIEHATGPIRARLTEAAHRLDRLGTTATGTAPATTSATAPATAPATATGTAPATAPAPATPTLEALGRDRALLHIGPDSVELSVRHTELLVLLAARPHAMTTRDLATGVYHAACGDSTVRSELSRLRRHVGPWLHSENGRVRLDLDADFASVERLLREGRIRAAARVYRAPLLPASEAPGVVEAREQLDAWVRSAVMTVGDREALWAWLESASGRDDLPAWKRFLADVEFEDPRRPLAQSRVARLRDRLATR